MKIKTFNELVFDNCDYHELQDIRDQYAYKIFKCAMIGAKWYSYPIRPILNYMIFNFMCKLEYIDYKIICKAKDRNDDVKK